MFILCMGMYAKERILYVDNTVETDVSKRLFNSMSEAFISVVIP